ncbi:NADH dehydrogenase-like protein YumB [Siminovitchia terrae]|uniref:NADH dehydrogenase-like protein YumB n=1 Tax=Siminovitchia terrae TaxID=1914933 RepID=A0ABQ4KSQ2_SIMTE|nr:NAD(P)/FAD-dependent oxidoreductase [Siminovitchia terrae]GIN88990.1 NADH dehydrogenase-like protein YumB [Siminovitchia terrae]GIN95059.1 NADH dehydrogenase-like protein YumB [Siminovitchia terrae]
MRKPKIVVLGAGYGGLMTVTRLQKQLGSNDADIVLVNRNDYHYETTWLHEASAGTLSPDQVRYDIANVVDRSKVNFVKDTALKVDTEAKTVQLEKGNELSYDYLVIALGGAPETFGIQGLDKYAFSITNVDTARQIREHIEYQFATYKIDQKPERLTIVVGGAGFTGIEFLGELGNRIPELCKEYDIEKDMVKVVCVEAAPTALPGFDPELVAYATALLERKNVEFRIGTAIKEATPEGIVVAKGEDETEEIKASTVVWAAGVRGNPIIVESGIENMRGRVKVEPDLRAPGLSDVFVIGDCSLVINEEINRPYPPTAQIAMQQGEFVANNLVNLLNGKTPVNNFIFDNKGTVCSLGDDDAIGVVFGKKVTGTKASFMKKMIDNRALYMIGGVPLTMKKGKFNLLK